MNQLEALLLGVALGAVPSAELGRIMVALLGKWAGVKPKQIEEYNEAAEDTQGD